MAARPIISAPTAAAANSPPIPSVISIKSREAKPLPQGTLYTCPMHPEIVQEGPGPCPICGMALEPMGVPPEHEHGGNPELVDFTRRLWVAVPLSLALIALDMGSHVFGVDLLPFLSPHAEQWLKLALAIAGGAVVRLAVLRARLRVAALGLAEHVHPDRPRHRRGLSLQPGGDHRAGAVPGGHAGRAWSDPDSISRRRRSSSRWSCSARCSSSGHARRPAAPSARCSTLRRRPHCAC